MRKDKEYQGEVANVRNRFTDEDLDIVVNKIKQQSDLAKQILRNAEAGNDDDIYFLQELASRKGISLWHDGNGDPIHQSRRSSQG